MRRKTTGGFSILMAGMNGKKEEKKEREFLFFAAVSSFFDPREFLFVVHGKNGR